MAVYYGPEFASSKPVNHFAPGPALAVLNVNSGWDDGSGCSEQLSRKFEEAGVPLRVELVKSGADITGMVRNAVREGVTGVVAGGGDGTLNGVAQGLCNTEVPMAVLPIGTLNHLARDLGVPLDISRAIEAIDHSREVAIDLGQVNGRIFLNNSIIGLYPAYYFARDRRERRGWRKWRAIASALVSVIRGNPTLRVRLVADGRPLERRTPYILVANNEHRMEGYRLGERERLDCGMLWIYVMRPLSRWGMIRLAFSILLGLFDKRNDFEVFAAHSMRVESHRRRLGVALDGDVVRMAMPLEYRSLPGALHVMRPVPPETGPDPER
jgi:diacylglycerol kinase family enzyme